MIGVAILSITLVPALIPDVHPRPAAERGRELAGPQLDRHLQAGAHLGNAAPKFRALDLRGAVDPRRRPVPAQCAVRRFRGKRRFWSSSAIVTIAHGHLHRRPSLAALVVRKSWRSWAWWRPISAASASNTCRRSMKGASSICRSPCRGPRSRKRPTTSRPATRCCGSSRRSSRSSARRAEPRRRPIRRRWTWSRPIVNLRPKEHWPKRLLRYPDAMAQTGVVLAALEHRGLIKTPDDKAARQAMINDATMAALDRLDSMLRSFTKTRFTCV